MDKAITRYAKAKGISEQQAIQQFKNLNKRFNSLYGTSGLGFGVFDINNENQRKAHDAMGAAFKKDPALFEAFDEWREVNGGGGVKDALISANNTLGFKDGARGLLDDVFGTTDQADAYDDLFGAYGFTQNADGSFSEPHRKKLGEKASDENVRANSTPTDTKLAEEETPSPKTLDQPEGGAAPAPAATPAATPAAVTQPTGPTGAGQSIKNINDAAQSLPANVPLGTGGATKANRARMNMQAEADRQMGDFIKQQKKQSDQNNFLRDRYDATGGRRAGAWDRLSDQQKDEAVANYRNRSFFDDSNPFHQQQYNDLKESGYQPPKADIQSQYEAASMNPPVTSRPDGTATTAEFGSMNPAQQRAFIQNYKYNPQGQSPETVKQQAVSPLDDPSIPDYSDKIVDVKQPISPLDDPSIPDYSDKIVDVKQPISPLDDPSIPDYSDKIVDAKSSLDDPGTLDLDGMLQLKKDREGHLNRFQGAVNNYTGNDPRILEANQKGLDELQSRVDSATSLLPMRSSSIPDYSDKIVDVKSPLDDPSIPDYSDKIVDAAPKPVAENNPIPAPVGKQVKAQTMSPVYGKKSDGTYGVTGYRDNNEMKKSMGGMRVKPFTAAMDRDRREKDLTDRAQKGLVSNPFNSDYNRALGQKNEDAYAERRKRQKALFNPYFS
jgi:hypothetical protein